MHQKYPISRNINATSRWEILRLCFDTFSSKSSHVKFYANNYKQSCSYDFMCRSFTGNDPRKGWRTPLNQIIYSEQRDEETGYCYFGARYMDHELMTMWLSVDPMMDKYPSISPYAYCAWNPVKLVDPDGMEVEYSSFGDWLRVSFARLVSKDFNSKYKILKASEETYVFNGVSEKELGEGRGGEFTTDGGKLIINYRLKGKESEGDNCFVNLLHETEHAIQFEYGEVGFINVDGEWLGALKSFDISDEYNAREAGYSWPFYLSSNPNSTRKIWNMQSKEDNIDLLRTSETYAPLKDGPLYNKNTERIQNEKEFALPHRPR